MSEFTTASPRGAQPERTALSWQRTALASIAGAAVIARHSSETLGVVALLLFLGTAGLAVAAFVLGWHRYDLSPGETARRRDGRAPFALALAIVAMALTELLALVTPGD
ncbi:DUF202 domain-containing protein [Janibacter cremeus]|uniref:Uncharacterized membrane protein YidH (DUF202 family) n=1 Tax=Janibacter cremeus TaxID=1285192 RepID=A0A852VY48_9MICO|nr:DUF202 domain-containing protein [Janibacter cremeus]NYF98675.1 uncharacterized membrane protein YidH (DUF202 family) [Janibacter cremeus]